jgi:DNA-binding MarR family transcriptional regulator
MVGEVLDHAPNDLRPLELLVLIALAEAAHDTDRTAIKNSSADAIAYRIRSTPGSVRNALVRLKSRGLIRPKHSKIHTGQSQNWTLTKLSDHHREATIRADPEDP